MSPYERVRLRFLREEAEGYLLLALPEQALQAVHRAGPNPEFFRKDFLYLKGESLRELKRYREAIPPLKQAARCDVRDDRVWLALGWCYKRTCQLDRAIDALDRARRACPDKPLISYNLACYWSLAGNKHLALHYLRRALDLDADYRKLIPNESDFDPLRADPDFQALTSIVV